MTRSAIVTDLKKLIGPGCEVTDDGLAVWVNDSYMQVVDEISKQQPDFFTTTKIDSTVSGTQEYDLPADFEKMLMVNIEIDGVWKRCRPMPNINYIPIHSRTDSNQGFSFSDPYYYIIGDKIGFMPIPDETTSMNIKYWYVYTPAELDEDSAEPAIPKKFHYMLKYGAYANYLDQDDEHVAAERMRQRFDALMARMVESINERQVDEPKSVEITQNVDLYVDETQYI